MNPETAIVLLMTKVPEHLLKTFDIVPDPWAGFRPESMEPRVTILTTGDRIPDTVREFLIIYNPNEYSKFKEVEGWRSQLRNLDPTYAVIVLPCFGCEE